MRLLRQTVPTMACATLAAASTLVAQPSPAPARVALAPLQTATFDVAAAFNQHYRATIEPLVFGRFAIGISGEYTTEPDAPGYINYPAYDSCPINRLCASTVSGDDSDYRAWSFNLHARWYPAALSLGAQRQSVSFYLGEFIGYHERRVSQIVYYGCPLCAYPPQDSTYYPPLPPPARRLRPALEMAIASHQLNRSAVARRGPPPRIGQLTTVLTLGENVRHCLTEIVGPAPPPLLPPSSATFPSARLARACAKRTVHPGGRFFISRSQGRDPQREDSAS